MRSVGSLAVLFALALGACGNGRSPEQVETERANARKAAAEAELAERTVKAARELDDAREARRLAEAKADELAREVEDFRSRLATLGDQMDEANAALVAAKTDAERAEAVARQKVIRDQQRAVQDEIDAARKARESGGAK